MVNANDVFCTEFVKKHTVRGYTARDSKIGLGCAGSAWHKSGNNSARGLQYGARLGSVTGSTV